MDKFIILRALLTRRQTATGWSNADDMNSVEHPRELSRVLRERKYPFKLPVLHAFPLINKMHARREEKQWRSFSEKGPGVGLIEEARGCGRGRGGGGRAMLRQTIEYAWYTNKAKALDTPGEMHTNAHRRRVRVCAGVLPIPGTYKCT